MDRCDLCQDEAEWYLTPEEGPKLCTKHFQIALGVIRLWVLREGMKNMARNGKTKEPITRIDMAVRS